MKGGEEEENVEVKEKICSCKASHLERTEREKLVLKSHFVQVSLFCDESFLKILDRSLVDD